ncbi:complex I NDUFA9 subunit family protein [Piscinibacter sakaiensis]|uniref:complex I NDUFA9 subunit family protein n=1 Tax=Piscinibacter sakaiensis TaxID=1547922 RepID=UPI00372879B7
MIPPEGPRRILVLGGSGFVGRSVCERLVALRHLPTLALPAADLRDDATLAALVAGHDAVIHPQQPAGAGRFDHCRPRRLVAAACRAQGVRRLLHVSALGVAPDAPSDYLRSKAAGEAALLAAGLDLTIFRPSVIFGAADRFMNTFARLQSLAPVVPLAGASARFQPVWVEDVAAAIVAALDRPETIGRTYECAGPAEFTLAELVRLAGTWAGHPRPVFGLPDGIAGLQARLMECLPGEPLLSRDNLRSMQVPNVATGTLPGLAALGIDRRRAGALRGGAMRRCTASYGAGARRRDAPRASPPCRFLTPRRPAAG